MQLRLPIRSLVLMNHAFRNGLVQLAAGDLQRLGGGIFITGSYGLTSFANVSLEFRLDRFVASASLLVSLNPLDLRLNICHVSF